ncbi:hypothetical protein WOLCODRAFT_21976 [Wolfiporia cocos MD-104 SS10]|uniref:Mitochondrial import inner membrane translocase subunit Tim21 n=1 Tax=Wolfiporia cocos (strain MD-104) TaxID=742152 RepID=A0A2H3J9P3_WOLCO|nr:hypothetical protein WOLCODRAFT_21976 [Wolfiporia cocos MD-104 SS10]
MCPATANFRPRHLRTSVCRSYATTRSDRPTSSSLLSQTLDDRHHATHRQEYVGPFQLGLIPPTSRDGKKLKKWSELSTAGKVARTTARTTNLAVILAGAGFSAVLIYALTSELFSKNSPTVLYGQACEKLRASPQLARVLEGPLVFHNNPPSAIRPRHRNHHVSSQLVVDPHGREHMLLHFYVQGRTPGSAPPADAESNSYIGSAVDWTKETASRLSDTTLDEFVEGLKARTERAKHAAKDLFKFLSGESLPQAPVPQPIKQEVKHEEPKGWTSSFTGLFSGLRGVSRGASDGKGDAPDLHGQTEGEAHADLVMDDQGYFQFRYLFVDVPNSQNWNSKRIFIERANGVRDNEPLISWRHS